MSSPGRKRLTAGNRESFVLFHPTRPICIFNRFANAYFNGVYFLKYGVLSGMRLRGE
jgi:hypothetical protein